MSDYKTINDRLFAGEVVYLLDDFEEAVFLIDGAKTLIRRKGKPAYSVKTEERIVMEAKLAGKVITEKEYLAY